MSVLALCGDRAEYICPKCAKCPTCCKDEPLPDFVHINQKEAAQALARAYRKLADDARAKAAGPPPPPPPPEFS